jgi:ribonuclease R
VIRSRRRCSYQEVAAWLELPDDRWPEDVQPLRRSLRLLDEAARRLRRARSRRGGIDLDLDEPELVLDATGRVTSIRTAERTEAHRLIEDLMVAANECVARILLRHDQPALHRVHDEPSPDRLESLVTLLAELGYEVDLGTGTISGALQQILDLSSGRPEHRLVATMVLRSLSRAHYSPDPRGHHALAADAYLHFTSPIRRYPDLVCHRMLRRLLTDGTSLSEDERATAEVELAQLGGACSATEQRAETAEREARRWLTVLYLRDRVGEVFPGHITGVTEFGVFVELEPFQLDGMIHISDLGDDYYSLDPLGHQLLGQRTIRARLIRVDTGALQVQLVPVDDPEHRPRRGKRSGKPASAPRPGSRSGRRSRSR